MDGEDPESTRPPLLVLESLKSKSVDIEQVGIRVIFMFVQIKHLEYLIILSSDISSGENHIAFFENSPFIDFKHIYFDEWSK